MLEFHWYAAEEEGIYGSGEVSEAYARQQINVMTYLNLDQSGYIKPGTTPTVAVMTDGMARSSTQFLTKVVDALSSEQRGLSR